MLPMKYSGEIREEKVRKTTKNLWGLIYFTCSTIYGYSFLKDLPFFPRDLLGNGHLHKIYDNFPYHDRHPQLTPYYMLGMAYHMESTITHIIAPWKTDFIEMLLHHVVTITLIMLSYVSNYSDVGMLVLILIDVGDIFASMMKCVYDICPTSIVMSTYVVLNLTWFYTRCYFLPFRLIRVTGFELDATLDGSYTPQNFLTGGLIILTILNYWWYALFIRMLLRFLKTGEKVDVQSEDSKMVTKKVKIN
jgi:acyl-CoA-dependent ceramide synthase